ncbi:ATP-binding cassette domain-containing protein, partial [Nocardia tengchongensis]|uniref:ATP-binding cassette domain-containing protein n=1 Tax=Nocardia tengchongensis TaxID=2055889 RepID=UPI00368FD9C5
MSEPLLRITGLNKSFGPVHVLHDVDLTVPAGEVTALVGDNGAGKSTLVKCVAGIHAADSGEVRFRGEPVHLRGAKDAAALGIEVVYQDLALADNLDIVANMFLGRERGKPWLLDEASMEEAARRTLASLGGGGGRGGGGPPPPPVGGGAPTRGGGLSAGGGMPL